MIRRIYIAGDSVAQTRKESNELLSGWGQHLEDFIDPDIEVVNRARDGANARWFFEHRMPLLMDGMGPGDLFLIAFGVVDQAIVRPDLYHTPEEFRAYLHLYADVVQESGAQAVLVTQPARHIFSPEGRLKLPGGDYSGVVRDVAAERGLPLLDLQGASAELLQELGPDQARGYFRWVDAGEHHQRPAGIIDTLHYNRAGARAVGQCAVRELQRAGLLAAHQVSKKVRAALPAPRQAAVDLAAVRDGWAATWSQLAVGEELLVVTSPRSGLYGHATTRLTGKAPSWVSQVLVFEGDQLIGATGVGAQGEWLWRPLVNWTDGDHRIALVGVSDSAVTPMTGLEFHSRSVVDPPVIMAPESGSWSGPRPVFKGTVQPGVGKVVALSGGRWVGEADVAPGGGWRYRLPHEWWPGEHSVDFIAVQAGMLSASARHTFRVLAVPPSNWLRQAPAGWQQCAPAGMQCRHIEDMRPKGTLQLLE
ncbi:hypothetical protein ABZ769_36700 [Streptomyces olivoreticuli]